MKELRQDSANVWELSSAKDLASVQKQKLGRSNVRSLDCKYAQISKFVLFNKIQEKNLLKAVFLVR